MKKSKDIFFEIREKELQKEIQKQKEYERIAIINYAK